MKTPFTFSNYLTLIVLFVFGIFNSANAQKNRSVQGEISVPHSIGELHFSSPSSLDFIVETHARPEITYTISVMRDKWSKNDTLINNQLVSVEETGNTQNISFSHPFSERSQNSYKNKEMSWIKALLKGDSSKKNRNNNNHLKTTVRLTIPEDLPVTFSLNYGDLDLRGLNADLTLNGTSADITLTTVNGNLTIENSYGDIELDDIDGDVKIDTQSSDIEIENLTGNLTIKTGYSDIELAKVKGGIYIDNRSGDITMLEITGDVELLADYSDVEINNAEGEISSNMRSGELIIQNLSGGLTHLGEYTEVELTTISGTGTISLEGRSAEYKLFEIRNSVTIVGDYLDISGNNLSGKFSSESKSTDVDLSEISGDIYLTGNNEIRITKISSNKITIDNSREDTDLSFEESLPAEIDITTNSGDVTLDLENITNPSATFNLNVQNGTIITDYPDIDWGTVRQNNNGQMLETVSGNGDAKITISVSNGTLRIR